MKLTDRALGTPYSGSLIHIVNPNDTSQDPAGSSYKTPLSSVLSSSLMNSNDKEILYKSGSAIDSNPYFRFDYSVSSLMQGNNTTSSGLFSHAEGASTQAIGESSHAEGFNTVTSGSYQHAQGQFNISSSAQSAFIIGNGTSNLNRSNLVFASGSQFQITGSLNVSGAINTVGNLTVQGNITAQQYIVSTSVYFVTESFLSGSHIFGNSVDDTHQFTGSVLMAGPLNVSGSGNFTNGLTVTGSINTPPNSILNINSINVGSGDNTTGTINVWGGNPLNLQRVQCSLKFNLGNDDSGDPTQIISDNTTGLQISSSGYLHLSASVVGINDILRLTPRSTTPGSPTNGMIIVSGSGVDQHIYCYLNSTWKQLD
jgi:hypothetical protein